MTNNIQPQQHHSSSSPGAAPPSSKHSAVSAQMLRELLENIRAVIREEITQAQEPDSLLDVDAVARRLSVSKRTVETIIAEGKLRPIWVRGSRRFTPEAIDAYIRRQARATRSGRAER